MVRRTHPTKNFSRQTDTETTPKQDWHVLCFEGVIAIAKVFSAQGKPIIPLLPFKKGGNCKANDRG
jgi:hypothetical protein